MVVVGKEEKRGIDVSEREREKLIQVRRDQEIKTVKKSRKRKREITGLLVRT